MSMIIGFSGKTVLVTGGGRGLGKDMSLLFAECGANVMVAGRGAAHLEKTVEEIRIEEISPPIRPVFEKYLQMVKEQGGRQITQVL